MTAVFNQQTITDAIHTKWAGKTVHFVKETASTNQLAKQIVGELPEQEPFHGMLVTAEHQTAGRGRLGRSWLAPAGKCVTMTLLLKPDFAPQYASMLTLVMGLSVAEAIGKMGLEAWIKWPNDVVVSRKKICGILTEMSLDGTEIREVAVGVGINVNLQQISEEMKEIATSMYLESGKQYDKNQVIAQVLECFEKNYEIFEKRCDLRDLMEDYNRRLINRGRPVRVLDPQHPFEGTARGINEQGELLVEREDGRMEQVRSGEVSVRGLFHYV